ncbi:MAG TPA: molybdopterin-dependent oxidoreductase [Anaerolineales bacterium]|nr:molybdopterin-dependent oxidoreductase [Anaerolineales bacterium]
MNGTNLRFINTLILILFCILGITGLYGLVWPFPSSLFEIHRIAGWGLLVLLPWKAAIAIRSLRRGLSRRFDRSFLVLISLLLSVAMLTVAALVLVWKLQIGPYYIWLAGVGYSGIGWHWGIAMGLAPLFVIHAWHHWLKPKKVDFTERRQALKLMGLGAAAIAGWGLTETLARSIENEKTQRRFTGSREEGSFAGNAHPVTSGADQGKVRLDLETWSLRVTGTVGSLQVWTYADLLTQPTSEVTATLDCTGGWYTVQTWRGILLLELLEQAQLLPQARGIILRGVREYSAPFTLAQAQEILLATHVSEQVLDHPHGFPLRAVVPSRRGWHWVKWMTEVQVI